MIFTWSGVSVVPKGATVFGSLCVPPRNGSLRGAGRPEAEGSALGLWAGAPGWGSGVRPGAERPTSGGPAARPVRAQAQGSCRSASPARAAPVSPRSFPSPGRCLVFRVRGL